MIIIKQHGNFKNLEKFLSGAKKSDCMHLLKQYGEEGVAALSSATPVDSGLTASSWNYKVSVLKNSYVVTWTNSNVQNGVPIALILQYGHGTNNGGYVTGRDYINPAIRPVFDKLANQAWTEVTKG